MKVLHINSSDIKGGAARACNRITRALNSIGVETETLVQIKYQSSNNHLLYGNNSAISKGRVILDYIPRRLLTETHNGRYSFFDVGIRDLSIVGKYDLLHLHWINEGFFSYTTFQNLLRLNKPIVWTMHDLWAFTGGCHYPFDCNKYEKECTKCPQVNNICLKNLCKRQQDQKQRIYEANNKLKFVSPSDWLAECAEKSLLLHGQNINVIANPIDVDLFRPLDMLGSRQKYCIPLDKKVILFGSVAKDKIKGFDLLIEALEKLENKSQVALCVFGGYNEELKNLGYDVYSLGRINNENDLPYIYSLANLTVVPSRQENLSNVIMESLACNTPVVAFSIGGNSDMILHKKNGYLANKEDTKDLAFGISWLLRNYSKKNNNYAANFVSDNFSFGVIAQKYFNLYRQYLV